MHNPQSRRLQNQQAIIRQEVNSLEAERNELQSLVDSCNTKLYRLHCEVFDLRAEQHDIQIKLLRRYKVKNGLSVKEAKTSKPKANKKLEAVASSFMARIKEMKDANNM